MLRQSHAVTMRVMLLTWRRTPATCPSGSCEDQRTSCGMWSSIEQELYAESSCVILQQHLMAHEMVRLRGTTAGSQSLCNTAMVFKTCLGIGTQHGIQPVGLVGRPLCNPTRHGLIAWLNFSPSKLHVVTEVQTLSTS